MPDTACLSKHHFEPHDVRETAARYRRPAPRQEWVAAADQSGGGGGGGGAMLNSSEGQTRGMPPYLLIFDLVFAGIGGVCTTVLQTDLYSGTARFFFIFLSMMWLWTITNARLNAYDPEDISFELFISLMMAGMMSVAFHLGPCFFQATADSGHSSVWSADANHCFDFSVSFTFVRLLLHGLGLYIGYHVPAARDSILRRETRTFVAWAPALLMMLVLSADSCAACLGARSTLCSLDYQLEAPLSPTGHSHVCASSRWWGRHPLTAPDEGNYFVEAALFATTALDALLTSGQAFLGDGGAWNNLCSGAGSVVPMNIKYFEARCAPEAGAIPRRMRACMHAHSRMCITPCRPVQPATVARYERMIHSHVHQPAPCNHRPRCARYERMMVISIGAIVAGSVSKMSAVQTTIQMRIDYRMSIFVGTPWIAFIVKVFYFDLSPHQGDASLESHAMRVSKRRGVAWTLLHLPLFGAVRWVGAALQALIDEESAQMYHGNLSDFTTAMASVCKDRLRGDGSLNCDAVADADAYNFSGSLVFYLLCATSVQVGGSPPPPCLPSGASAPPCSCSCLPSSHPRSVKGAAPWRGQEGAPHRQEEAAADPHGGDRAARGRHGDLGAAQLVDCHLLRVDDRFGDAARRRRAVGEGLLHPTRRDGHIGGGSGADSGGGGDLTRGIVGGPRAAWRCGGAGCPEAVGAPRPQAQPAGAAGAHRRAGEIARGARQPPQPRPRRSEPRATQAKRRRRRRRRRAWPWPWGSCKDDAARLRRIGGGARRDAPRDAGARRLGLVASTVDGRLPRRLVRPPQHERLPQLVRRPRRPWGGGRRGGQPPADDRVLQDGVARHQPGGAGGPLWSAQRPAEGAVGAALMRVRSDFVVLLLCIAVASYE